MLKQTSQVALDLLTAADIIEKCGWVQCKLGSPEEGFCAVGAICHAVTDTVRKKRALDAVRASPEIEQYRSIHISDWNNDFSRCKEDVIKLLRDTAHAL